MPCPRRTRAGMLTDNENQQDPGQGPQGVGYVPDNCISLICLTILTIRSNKTVKFYEFLGMSLLKKLSFPDAKFDLYFLGYDAPGAVSHGANLWDREGLIELTHNYGTESDANYKVNNGNTEPHRGFGHTCISVDNLQAACQRLEEAGYKFQKKLSDGRMKHIAFALDPDGYWVEIIGRKPVEETAEEKETDLKTYRMNHTMLRVKDAEKSLSFYQEVLGMKLVRTHEAKEAGFNLYFLGYGDEKQNTADREGLLELTWNYGTEKDEGFSYHNGNDQPQGFGHICEFLSSPRVPEGG